MVRLFHPAYDNRLTGTVTSLESLQRLFAQNEGSGMIELHVALERVVLILMLSSRMVANFLVENEVVVGFDLVNLPRIGCGVTSPISYLQLSTQAVRAAWQAFEWNFGRQTVLAGPSPVESLEALKFENADGLLRLGIGSWCSGMEPTPWLTC